VSDDIIDIIAVALAGEKNADLAGLDAAAVLAALRDAGYVVHLRGKSRILLVSDYERAAAVYRDRFKDTPTVAVAEAFGVGSRRAGDIIAECRRRGLLPTTTQGKKQI